MSPEGPEMESQITMKSRVRRLIRRVTRRHLRLLVIKKALIKRFYDLEQKTVLTPFLDPLYSSPAKCHRVGRVGSSMPRRQDRTSDRTLSRGGFTQIVSASPD